jgi:hypothetical protein
MEHGREHISPHAKKDLLPGKPKAVPALTGRGGGGEAGRADEGRGKLSVSAVSLFKAEGRRGM